MNTDTKKGLLALSPMLMLIFLMVALSIWMKDCYKVPVVGVFAAVVACAFLTLRGMRFKERLAVFWKGVWQRDLILMLCIFILAGAFAASAKGMGAVEEMVNLTLSILPSNMVLPGVFVAAGLVSLSIGTSVGTIAALIPIVQALSAETGLGIEMLTAAAVGGAFFGDNLSFISDTTVVATKTQGCRMSDKFKTNFLIVLPAVLLCFCIYLSIGMGSDGEPTWVSKEICWLKVLPYGVVLLAALLGLNVLGVLAIGLILTGIIGVSTNSYEILGWFSAAADGISAMTETIMVAILSGGLLALIRKAGGIDWIIKLLTSQANSRMRGEFSIAALVSIVNLSTANNTVAILSVGQIAREISQRFGINPRKAASLLDTYSCFIQGLIPYGAQLLIASALAEISAAQIIPYLFYPCLLGIVATLSIVFQFPKIKV